jgi:hypothetical protein
MRLHIDERSGFLILEDVAGARGILVEPAYIPPSSRVPFALAAPSGAFLFVSSPRLGPCIAHALKFMRHGVRIGTRIKRLPPRGVVHAIRTCILIAASLCATAGRQFSNLDSPSVRNASDSPVVRSGPGYPGYDFTSPFKLDVFFEKHVPIARPTIPIRPLRFPAHPTVGFVRAPSDIPQGERLFAIAQGRRLQILAGSEESLHRELRNPLANCGQWAVFEVPPGARSVIASSEDMAFFSAPKSERDVCQRARVVADGIL